MSTRPRDGRNWPDAGELGRLARRQRSLVQTLADFAGGLHDEENEMLNNVDDSHVDFIKERWNSGLEKGLVPRPQG